MCLCMGQGVVGAVAAPLNIFSGMPTPSSALNATEFGMKLLWQRSPLWPKRMSGHGAQPPDAAPAPHVNDKKTAWFVLNAASGKAPSCRWLVVVALLSSVPQWPASVILPVHQWAPLALSSTKVTPRHHIRDPGQFNTRPRRTGRLSADIEIPEVCSCSPFLSGRLINVQ